MTGLVCGLLSHPFWAFLIIAVIIWYSTITIYVAIRGLVDIIRMFGRIGKQRDEGRTRGPCTIDP